MLSIIRKKPLQVLQMLLLLRQTPDYLRVLPLEVQAPQTIAQKIPRLGPLVQGMETPYPLQTRHTITMQNTGLTLPLVV